jgi:type I restriction enzyme R subunit
MLTTERLWSAYARVQASQVKGADAKRQLTDLVSLVRFALGLDGRTQTLCRRSGQALPGLDLPPQRPARHRLHAEQTDWLRLMKDHIASSCSISREDFDYAELADKGGLQEALPGVCLARNWIR